jgi:hypothetical protein
MSNTNLTPPETWEPGATTKFTVAPLTKSQVTDVMLRQAVAYKARRASTPRDEVDGLVEAHVMYQLLADMASQHAELVERIK